MEIFSTFVPKHGENQVITIETFDYVRNYQAQLISYMIYEPTTRHKAHRDLKLFNEIQACELWMKKHVWKLQ